MTAEETAGGERAIQWTRRAREDLSAIGEYIAVDDPVAAVRWLDRLDADVKRAADLPLSGRVVPEVRVPSVREIIRGKYRIVYRVREDAIDVLTVFEGHRRFPEDLVAP